MGGDDPYSASKGCAELIFRSYYESYFKGKESARISSVRAGNVIGGGDWADARIVPDCVRAWSEEKEVLIRNPGSTRPWRHVLEPLSGYLWVGANLFEKEDLNGESFNFGPDSKTNKTVSELIGKFNDHWKSAKYRTGKSESDKKESNLLRLCCDKALNLLNWHAALSFDETVRYTAEWYQAFYEGRKNMFEFTKSQIQSYMETSFQQDLAWVKGRLV